MPKLYENIKSEYIKKGKSYDKAQSIAAAIYNKIRSSHPLMAKLSNKKGTK